MLIKRTLHQEGENNYKYMHSQCWHTPFHQKCLKAQIDPSTKRVGDFNTPFSQIHRSSRQKKINKETRIK
jgi:hypothetical protein